MSLCMYLFIFFRIFLFYLFISTFTDFHIYAFIYVFISLCIWTFIYF